MLKLFSKNIFKHKSLNKLLKINAQPVNMYPMTSLFLLKKSFFFNNNQRRFSSTRNSEESHEDGENSKNVDDLFIKEENSTNSNEILPIKQKIADLIAENEEFQEYTRIVNIAKILLSEFDLDKFKIMISYINVNQVTDVFLHRQFESIFIKNLNQIDFITKATCVNMLGEYINKKKTSFQEDNWLMILKDFQSIVENMNFAEYYTYVSTFDKLFVKKKVHELGGKYTREFDNFMSFQNVSILNTGKVKLKKMEDVFLFSKLLHAHVVKIININENIWLSINKIIEANAEELTIYECLILTSLFINFQEVSGRAHIFLLDAIKEINNFISSLLINFELLEYSDQENIITYSDNLFNYYVIFMHVNKKKGEDSQHLLNSPLISTLIKIYTEKLKSKTPDFMILKEFRILQLLSKEVGYKDKDFWKLAADKTIDYINTDFMKILNDIFPKKLLKNSSLNDEEKIRFQEKCDLQILLYVGMIIETFSSAEYTDMEFWNSVLQKMDNYAHFKNKDIFVILNFISLGCKRLFRKEEYAEVWEKFTDLLEPKLKKIFRNREIVEFLVKINSPNTSFDTITKIEKDTNNTGNTKEIKIDELNKCLNNLFLNDTDTSDNSNIKLFSSFFTLIENKIQDDDKVNYFYLILDY